MKFRQGRDTRIAKNLTFNRIRRFTLSNEHYYQQALMCRERVMRRLAARKKTVRLVRRSSIVRKSLPQRPEPWVVDARAAN